MCFHITKACSSTTAQRHKQRVSAPQKALLLDRQHVGRRQVLRSGFSRTEPGAAAAGRWGRGAEVVPSGTTSHCEAEPRSRGAPGPSSRAASGSRGGPSLTQSGRRRRGASGSVKQRLSAHRPVPPAAALHARAGSGAGARPLLPAAGRRASGAARSASPAGHLPPPPAAGQPHARPRSVTLHRGLRVPPARLRRAGLPSLKMDALRLSRT